MPSLLNLIDVECQLGKYSEQELLKMPVDSFALVMQDAEILFNDELEKFIDNNSPSKKFIERISLKQNTNLALKYSSFIKYHKYSLPEEKKPLPDSFQKFIDVMPLDDMENCKEIGEYRYFLYQYHQDNITKKMKTFGIKRETVAYINKLADEIIALNAPQEIKDDITVKVEEGKVVLKRPSDSKNHKAKHGGGTHN